MTFTNNTESKEFSGQPHWLQGSGWYTRNIYGISSKRHHHVITRSYLVYLVSLVCLASKKSASIPFNFQSCMLAPGVSASIWLSTSSDQCAGSYGMSDGMITMIIILRTAKDECRSKHKKLPGKHKRCTITQRTAEGARAPSKQNKWPPPDTNKHLTEHKLCSIVPLMCVCIAVSLPLVVPPACKKKICSTRCNPIDIGVCCDPRAFTVFFMI
jgi:hypothetical protein